jgi:hypothetical protein
LHRFENQDNNNQGSEEGQGHGHGAETKKETSSGADPKAVVESPAKVPFKIKDVKKIHVTSKISDHDLAMKSSQIRKWVKKMCEVRVVVSGDDETSLQKCFTLFESHLKGNVRILQKRISNGSLKFTASPIPSKDGMTPEVDMDKGQDEESDFTIDSNQLITESELEQMIDEKLSGKKKK